MPRAKTTPAKPAPLVRQVSQDTKFAFVECHAEGHQWRHLKGIIDPLEADPGMRPAFGSTTARGRRSQCTSCGMHRVRWYTRGGEVVNRYKAADGYYHDSKADSSPAPSRLEWRQTLCTTLFDTDLGKPIAAVS